MTTSPQSRIQVLDVPLLAPGVCFVCGTAGINDGPNERKFIDFGKQIDWYGAVYLCSECIKEVAIAVGFIPVADFDTLHTEYRDSQVEKDLAVARYNGVVSALDTLFANYRPGDVSTDDVLRAPVPFVETPGGVEITNEEPDKRESETDESVDVEGSDDLFDDTDFE